MTRGLGTGPVLICVRGDPEVRPQHLLGAHGHNLKQSTRRLAAECPEILLPALDVARGSAGAALTTEAQADSISPFGQEVLEGRVD